jgi:hypothetical protein
VSEPWEKVQEAAGGIHASTKGTVLTGATTWCGIQFPNRTHLVGQWTEVTCHNCLKRGFGAYGDLDPEWNPPLRQWIKLGYGAYK